MNRTLLVLALAGAMSADARTWTSVSGATVEADFVGLQGSMVVLKKPEGQQLKIGLALLSKEDQDFARQQGGGSGSAGDAAPATTTPAVAVAAAPHAGAPAAAAALANRNVGIRTGNTLTEEQIAGLKQESSDEKPGETLQFRSSFSQVPLDAKELKKWEPKDGIKYRVTCELLRVKTVKGKATSERLGGSSKFYLTDDSGAVVMSKSQSLDSMCPT